MSLSALSKVQFYVEIVKVPNGAVLLGVVRVEAVAPR